MASFAKGTREAPGGMILEGTRSGRRGNPLSKDGEAKSVIYGEQVHPSRAASVPARSGTAKARQDDVESGECFRDARACAQMALARNRGSNIFSSVKEPPVTAGEASKRVATGARLRTQSPRRAIQQHGRLMTRLGTEPPLSSQETAIRSAGSYRDAQAGRDLAVARNRGSGLTLLSWD